MLPFEDFSIRPEWFIQGTEPTAKSSWYKKIEICKTDKKIANESCKKADKTKVNTYIKITAELPEWQDSVDKWVQEQYGDDGKYFPPATTSRLEFDADGNPTVAACKFAEIIKTVTKYPWNLDFRPKLRPEMILVRF